MTESEEFMEEHVLWHHGQGYKLIGVCLAEEYPVFGYCRKLYLDSKSKELYLYTSASIEPVADSIVRKISLEELIKELPNLARRAGLLEIHPIDDLPNESEE